MNTISWRSFFSFYFLVIRNVYLLWEKEKVQHNKELMFHRFCLGREIHIRKVRDGSWRKIDVKLTWKKTGKKRIWYEKRNIRYCKGMPTRLLYENYFVIFLMKSACSSGLYLFTKWPQKLIYICSQNDQFDECTDHQVKKYFLFNESKWHSCKYKKYSHRGIL